MLEADEPANELAAVKKELQTVKTRAVGKIKALQAQVDDLQVQLLAEKSKSPPEVSSASEDGSEKGFVKVADNAARLRELEAREAALAQRGRGAGPEGTSACTKRRGAK